MKKILIACLLGVAALLALGGCGKKETKSVVGSKDEITYEKLYEANKGSLLMEKYDCVTFELSSVSAEYDENNEEIMDKEKWSLFKQDGDYVITREADTGESIVYGEGTCYYMMKEKGKSPVYSYGWFMDGMYQEFMSAKVDQFLLDKTSDEDFDEITENDNNYIVKSYIGEDKDEKYYYRYSLDKTTLELQKYEAVIEKSVNDSIEEQIVASSIVSYDKKGKMPEYVKTIKGADKDRTVTVHQVKDGKVEKDIEVKIPKNATMMAALADGYGLYLDVEGGELYDDTLSKLGADGSYPDNECYLVYTGTAQ